MLVHLRQVHPLKLAASVSIRAICGRTSPASGSVSSVQSVGEYSQAEGSVSSVHSVGEPTHQAEFALLVFVSSQGYMCVSYIVLSDSNKFKLC